MSDKIGRISLWESDGKDGRPVLRGEIEMGNTKVRCSLWPNPSDNARAPKLTGEVETYESHA